MNMRKKFILEKNLRSKTSQQIIVYGKHACLSVLENNKREIYQIFLDKEKIKNWKELIREIFHEKISICSSLEIEKITKIADKHQGIAIKCSENFKKNITIEDIVTNEEKNEKSCIFILDSIQDPQNLGTLLRSAYAFDINTIIISERNSCPITSAVIRTSTGYCENMNILYCNINNAIEKLKKNNFWIFTLDIKTENNIYNIKSLINKYNKKVFLFGSEGFGVSELAKKNTDIFIKIPMKNNVESLNLANTVTIIAYEINRN